jgi:hypothetical protein
MGPQTKLLGEVLSAIEFSHSVKDRQDIFAAHNEIWEVVRKHGENGMMALAICGLERASKAEIEEVREVAQ